MLVTLYYCICYLFKQFICCTFSFTNADALNMAFNALISFFFRFYVIADFTTSLTACQRFVKAQIYLLCVTKWQDTLYKFTFSVVP